MSIFVCTAPIRIRNATVPRTPAPPISQTSRARRIRCWTPRRQRETQPGEGEKPDVEEDVRREEDRPDRVLVRDLRFDALNEVRGFRDVGRLRDEIQAVGELEERRHEEQCRDRECRSPHDRLDRHRVPPPSAFCRGASSTLDRWPARRRRDLPASIAPSFRCDDRATSGS
jgi:hypothetical protein